MALQFDPPAGTVLLCDYSTGFRHPEMVKRRPALVLSPRLRRRSGLCSVVPLSTTPPHAVEDYHHQVTLLQPPPEPWHETALWAKADMVATVSFGRLEMFRTGRDQYGKRKYLRIRVSEEDLAAVRACVRVALGC